MSKITPETNTLNTNTQLTLRDLRIPSYASNILYALERGFEKFTLDTFIIGDVASAIWLETFDGILEQEIMGRLDFGVILPDWSSFQDLKNYLTDKNELTQTRIFWNERNTPYTLEYLPEPFTVNLAPFEIISRYDYDYINAFYESGLFKVELDKRFILKYNSFEGTILEHVLSWNFKDSIIQSMKSVSETIHLIYSLFNCNWEKNALFDPYKSHVDKIIRENENDIHFNFYWQVYGVRIVSERIREILKRDLSIQNTFISKLDECLEYYKNASKDRTVIEFQIGSTSCVRMNGSDVSAILYRLKRRIES